MSRPTSAPEEPPKSYNANLRAAWDAGVGHGRDDETRRPGTDDEAFAEWRREFAPLPDDE